MRFRFHNPVALLLALLGTCAGCAATRPSVPDVAYAEGAIEEAEVAGAQDDMNASLYLAVAHSELAKAQVRLARGDQSGAARWAKRARTDAELAALFAHEAYTRNTANRTFEHARSMEEQLEQRER